MASYKLLTYDTPDFDDLVERLVKVVEPSILQFLEKSNAELARNGYRKVIDKALESWIRNEDA